MAHATSPSDGLLRSGRLAAPLAIREDQGQGQLLRRAEDRAFRADGRARRPYAARLRGAPRARRRCRVRHMATYSRRTPNLSVKLV